MTNPGSRRRNLIAALQWKRLDTPGSEHFSLFRVSDGLELEGIVVVTLDGKPLIVWYTVRCDEDWGTRDLEVTVRSGARMWQLRLKARDGRWDSADGPLAAIEGAVDVDLGVTPSTNTLPIRRLELEIGQHADLVVAWVRFPDLSVLRSDQRYTRLAENTYRYESGSFRRDIEVDDLGLVTTYPGLFVRESFVSG